MRYLFDLSLLQAIQDAFILAQVKDEVAESSDPNHRDYFFCEFQQHPTTAYDELAENDEIDVILSGDKKLSDICNIAVESAANIKCGFRWTSSFQDTKKIVFLGFCIKIIYHDDKATVRAGVINRLCDVLRDTALITHDLSQQFQSVVTTRFSQRNHFFKLSRPRDIEPQILKAVKAAISKHILPILPAYARPNELSINPAYQDASIVRERLHLNQKKIWLLRSDFIFALGTKNAYWTSFADRGLSEVIDERLHRFVNWEDRYGHPSLASAHPGYQSDAYYGGLLAQRNGYLEVFTSSGRYYRNDLNENDKGIMEAYIASILQKTYGDQKIIFQESTSNLDYFECALFYHDDPLPTNCLKREYDFARIMKIFSMLQSASSFQL